MIRKHHVKELRILVAKLCDAGNAFGTYSAEYNSVIDEIHVFASRLDRSRRRRHYLPLGVIFFLICLLGWLVYRILIWLEF